MPPDYETLCTYDNLYNAYEGARKHKTLKPYIIEFEKDLKENLLQLQKELITETYKPRPLETFILRDPKTRKISKSDFRDRVIHHAICNIIEPIFDKAFIHDSYANRLGKGTLNAIARFDTFKKKVSKNNTRTCYFLKADIKHYFDTVDHNILLRIIKRKIHDEKIISLIKKVLQNHNTGRKGKGMPLGNLTSQFFANIYLDELDQYVKHQLKAKYYLRYVDDFIILEHSIDTLQEYQLAINSFLKERLLLELHPDKTKILRLEKGANFLGFRIFYTHKLIRKKNLQKFERNFKKLKKEYDANITDRDEVMEKFEGWIEYVRHANTYKYRRHLIKQLNILFPITPPIIETKIKKHENHIKRTESNNVEFSQQKTRQLLLKGLSIKEIALHRELKESTIYDHLTKLIEHNQLTVWDILPKEKIDTIRQHITSGKDTLKEIKKRINTDTITYDEIALVLAQTKTKNSRKNIIFHCSQYQKYYCRKRCYRNPKQQKLCKEKFNQFISKNPLMEIKRREFQNILNYRLRICEFSKKKKQVIQQKLL